MPRPPSSTLFPYTTLFRSLRGRAASGELDEDGESHGRREHGDSRQRDRVRRDLLPQLRQGLPHRGQRGRTVLEAWELGDRKSTRLNSSHSQISYAVFCLKK